MLIDKIVNYCDQEYSAQDMKHVCKDCKHDKTCSGSCKQCLEEIHYPNSFPEGKKDYDCRNLINFYVCDYSYKYASEIWYLLRKSEAIKSINEYHILSLGCGPCPDLMAFESYVQECGEDKTIFYAGIDKNKLWEPIHNQIDLYRNDIVKNTQFLYDDAIKYFYNHNINNANVLILQYIISAFYNTNQIDKIEKFYDELIINIIYHRNQNKPFVIIINDVNCNSCGRDLFMDFTDKLTKSNLHGIYNCYYFDYHIKNFHQRYGNKHESKEILYKKVPERLDKYDPWKVCSSAQLLIEVR